MSQYKNIVQSEIDSRNQHLQTDAVNSHKYRTTSNADQFISLVLLIIFCALFLMVRYKYKKNCTQKQNSFTPHHNRNMFKCTDVTSNGLNIRVFVIFSQAFAIIVMLLCTARIVNGQIDSKTSNVVEAMRNETNMKYYKNSSNSSSHDNIISKTPNVSTTSDVDLIKNNNMLTTAEVIVKEIDQERPQKREQEEKSDSSDNLEAYSGRHNEFSSEVSFSVRPNLIGSGTSSSVRDIIDVISRENVLLKRQLREKAKHDSLESIKMHILMRLKLTKLPNITSPIPVPQNILENFYKNYNTTQNNQNLRRGSHYMRGVSFEDVNGERKLFTQKPSITKNADDVMESTETKDLFNLQNDDGVAHHKVDSTYTEIFPDDSNENYQYFYSADYNNNNFKNFDEDIMSHINSIYIFPEASRIRHNRKSDLLHFKFDSSKSDISKAIMHLYIRGWDWIKEQRPDLLPDVMEGKNDRKVLVLTIHKAIRRGSSANYTHKLKILESRHIVPSGVGQWVKIDVIKLFTNWDRNRNESHEILLKGEEPWMRPLIVIADAKAKSPLTVHIEIETERKHRFKRSTSLDCHESDHEDRCCRYPLKVNFTNFGWHFVVAPTSFDAYFCNGECKVGYLEHYTHTHLTSLTASATPCCSPTKMSPLKLLYFDDNNKLVMSVIPNMSVEKCSCS